MNDAIQERVEYCLWYCRWDGRYAYTVEPVDEISDLRAYSLADGHGWVVTVG